MFSSLRLRSSIRHLYIKGLTQIAHRYSRSLKISHLEEILYDMAGSEAEAEAEIKTQSEGMGSRG